MRANIAPPPSGTLEPGPIPSFSIIVAAYEAAEYIGEAISSALGQTVAPLEVIVCDDGSTDDIEGALAPYGERITLLRREHGGEGAAKSSAARAARGDFVVILDADDTYLPDRIEALGELASARPDLDILTTDAEVVVDGRFVRRAYSPGWQFEAADQRRAILERNFIFGHAAVRRDVLLEAGAFDETILWTTDWDCWLRLIFAGSRAGLVDEPLSRYRLHEGALSSRRAKMLRGRVMTLEKAAREQRLDPREREVLERSLSRQRRAAALEEANAALEGGDPSARRRSLDIALTRAYGPRTRAKAALAALAPRLAGRRRASRKSRRWVGAGGTAVRREDSR